MKKVLSNGTTKLLCMIFCAVMLIASVITPLSLAANAAQSVKIIFTDTFNNKTEEVIGEKGTPIAFPTDPVDANGQNWFMDWCTDEACLNSFTGTVYEEDITLYSKWVSEYKSLTQDFENYTKDQYTVDSSTGQKKNRNYFFEGMEKQSAVTYNNSSYAIKLAWDSTMKLDASNPNSYNAASRYKQIDAKLWLGKPIDNNVSYTVTFKYKFEKAETSVKANVYSAADSNIWTNKKNYGGIALDSSSNEWMTASYSFTTNFVKTGETLYLVFLPSENKDYTIYIDDVVFTPMAQPYESTVTLQTNNGDPATILKGKRGDAIVFPEFENHGTELLGWFADRDFTTPFTATHFQRNNLTAYAKWSATPVTFKDYPYSFTLRAPYTLSIKNIPNIGQNDDYAVNFLYDADATYQSEDDAQPRKFVSRVNQKDNVIPITTVTSGTVYKVTYWRKAAEDSTSNYSIVLSTGASNVFTGQYIKYKGTRIVASANDKEWVKETVYFIPSFTNETSNRLYLQLNCTDTTEQGYVNAYIDNVIVQELTGDMLFFDTGSDQAKNEVVLGTPGDTFTIPTPFDSDKTFLGWYADQEFETPFNDTTLSAGFKRVYAKWGEGPMSFSNYPYNTSSVTVFGKTMKIKNKSNAGINDDYALNLNFKGNDVYEIAEDGTIAYMFARSSTTHSAKIGEGENFTVYKISFNYKVNKATNDFSMSVFSASKSNMWTGSTKYPVAAVDANIKEIGKWQSATCVIATNFKASSSGAQNNGLFFNFEIKNADMSSIVNVDIDNVLIQKVNAPYVYYNYTDGDDSYLLEGVEGEKIVNNNTPKCFGRVFTGWFLDSECKTPFTQKEFTKDTAVLVYAGWKDATKVTYNFENYDIAHKIEGSSKNERREIYLKSTSKAHSGKTVLEIKPSKDYASNHFAVVAEGDKPFVVNAERMYSVKVSYYIAKKGTNQAKLSVKTAKPTNFYASGVSNTAYNIPLDKAEGKWYSVEFIVDGSKIKTAGTGLFVVFKGGYNGIYYIDDVTISTISRGSAYVAVFNNDSKDIPTLIKGRVGENYYKKLPTKANLDGKFFKGYYTLESDGKYKAIKPEEMLFAKEVTYLYAMFIDVESNENFDDGLYAGITNKYGTLGIFDFDFELYDSKAPGNSADNVTSGDFSLHRKGNSPYSESAMLLTLGRNIANDLRYTATFKVKMGNYKHTEGAIKIASCRTHIYPWDNMSDFHPVIAIADLTDGEWHEVSYTFNSVEDYVSVNIPGDIEIFIDDVKLKITAEAPLSTPVEFVEHITGSQNNALNIDASTIIDISLTKNNTLLFIIIGTVGGLVVIGAIVFVIIKRKKNKKV